MSPVPDLEDMTLSLATCGFERNQSDGRGRESRRRQSICVLNARLGV